MSYIKNPSKAGSLIKPSLFRVTVAAKLQVSIGLVVHSTKDHLMNLRLQNYHLSLYVPKPFRVNQKGDVQSYSDLDYPNNINLKSLMYFMEKWLGEDFFLSPVQMTLKLLSSDTQAGTDPARPWINDGYSKVMGADKGSRVSLMGHLTLSVRKDNPGSKESDSNSKPLTKKLSAYEVKMNDM
ncbi:hypothetical protein ACFE04_021126 [Oxalis oulophora]